MIPRFLRPEILNYASIEIVRDPAAFHALLVDPTTSARLDAMLADNARIDAAFAAVVVEVELVPVSDTAGVVDVALVPKIDGAQ